MIVVTGAAGFIGSCLVSKLNDLGFNNLLLVDDFSSDIKQKNILGKEYLVKIDRLEFINWFIKNGGEIESVYHIGARTDTIEKDVAIFNELNLDYSKSLWKICVDNQIPLIYASSAACYGAGEFGFDDSHRLVNKLQPLNAYARSKNEFDKWVLNQERTPLFWAGFRFFNVYGPNEYHKERMASVISHAISTIRSNGEMYLFKSHNPDYQDGEQARDFIYVKDLIDVLIFMMNSQRMSAIYNLGTGRARTFNALAEAIFKSMGMKKNIVYVDTPKEIRGRYQYFTQANIQKLKETGYNKPFTELEDGVEDYVTNYLLKNKYF